MNGQLFNVTNHLKKICKDSELVNTHTKHYTICILRMGAHITMICDLRIGGYNT